MKKTIFANLVVFWAVTASASTAKSPVPAKYAPNELLVKFREPVANALELQHQPGSSAGRWNLSPGLDVLNARYRLKEIKPLFKDFKKNRQRLESLRKKDKSLLTKKEQRILRRLARAPKDAKVPDLSRIYKIELDLDPGESLEEAVEAYNNNPDVEYAELNYVVSIQVTPNDPLYPIQWPLHNTGQMYPESGKYNPPPGTPDCDIDAPEAWAIETGSPEVVVAVVDTGVDYAHRDLDDNMWTDENGYHGYDYVNDDSDPKDDNGHGTHCAGTIAAEGDNAFDIAGVCWNAKIMAVKFLNSAGYGDEGNVAAAFYYAVENGADVISNSWGGGSYTETAQEAIDYAYSQGVVMVAAAGNGNSDSPYYPACYDHMISVAATNSNDEKASFSNYGELVDIAAPGVDVLSLRAAGTSRGTVYDDHTTVASGTSMACPHVAGACALALSLFPDLQVDELEQILKESTDPIASGICQSGRLNLGAACLRLIRPKGVVRMDRGAYSCSAVVTFHLADRDLVAHGSQAVTVTTDGGDLETVVLTEIAANTGVFEGDIQSSGDAMLNEDGILQVSHGQVITVTYEDANDGTGSPATAEDTASVDCEPPGIFNINFSAFSTTAKVTFETDEPAAAFVLYGLTCAGPYSESAEGQALATTHTFHLRGLPSETQHYFVVGANDPVGNQAIDSNQGQCYSFITRPWSEGIRVPEEYETIQEAIDGAVDGQTVWVDAGVYAGGGMHGIDFKGKAITVRSVYGPELTIIDCQNQGRGFTFSNGEDANSVLDGLTIINGQHEDLYSGYGGGIMCFCSSPTIRNCVITNCWADKAGGIWCRAEAAPCSPTFINCTITNNRADAGKGGGIYCENSSPTIINCTIAGNEATDEGDISYGGVTPTMGEGGGIYCIGGEVTVINCLIRENTAFHTGNYRPDGQAEGGGICCWGSVLLLVNTTIADNYSDHRGGAIFCSDGNLKIRNCTIKDNDANLIHGGIYCIGGKLNVANCLVTGNYSKSTGAGISCENLSGVVTNCTFAGNSANGDGGGLRCGGGGVDISNSIFWNNSPYQIRTFTGFFSVTYSDVQGGWEGEGNIDADPLFVNAAGGDYYLMSDSPCIDAGTNEPEGGLAPTDINGVPRPMDGDDNGTMVADMGCYEYWEPVPGAPVIEVSTSLLEFSGVFRQANPPDQILSIRNWGEGTLVWEISEDCAWLNVEPNCGESTGEFDDVVLSVDIRRMVYGDYGCVLTIGAADAINSPRIVPVTLHIAIGISIQAAIDAAVAGSEVILPDGIYTGEVNRNITFRGKALTLRSKNGPQNCIIDCQEQGRGFYFNNSEGADSVLEGVTIRNGYAESGGGIWCGDASPTILNCVILNNRAADGGGIYCIDGWRWSPTIVNCVLKENVAAQHGGGFYSIYSNLAVKGCTFTGNLAGGSGGGLFCRSGTAHISNCTFISNSASGKGGGAFADVDEPSIIESCTFVDNEAGLAGGGIDNCSSSPIVTNCILWNNSPQQLAGLGTFSVTYSNMHGGWTGEGNIDVDPLFVNVANDDYHLLPGSPAIDTGHPLTDWSNEPWPNGGRVNMGAYGNTTEATRSSGDFEDLAQLCDNWLEYDPALDIAPEPVGDGIINFLDFALFAHWWLME